METTTANVATDVLRVDVPEQFIALFGIREENMRLFREEKGHTAYTIVESDERLPEGVDQLLLENPNIRDVMVVQQ